MYSIPSYAAMITDETRVEAYARALKAVITPESFVLEIGTGVGVFAVMAAQMGARRVVAIEPDDAIAVARALAKDNGVNGIEFLQALSKDVSLSERADVIVSDLRGMLPVYNGHIESIVDARKRLLAPGGALIPMSDTLYAAVVELPPTHALGRPRRTATGGVKLEALQKFVCNSWDRARVRPEQILSSRAPWASLDYRTVASPNVGGDARVMVERDGAAHGLAVWFDATIAAGVSFSNAPDLPELVYGSGFFPWPEPVAVRPGDEIAIRIDAHKVGDDYVWLWDSTVFSPDLDAPKARFRQSTFYAAPFVPAKLALGDGAHVAALNDEGRVEACILQSMDGALANVAIARLLRDRFPGRFATLNEALGRVGSVARRFSVV